MKTIFTKCKESGRDFLPMWGGTENLWCAQRNNWWHRSLWSEFRLAGQMRYSWECWACRSGPGSSPGGGCVCVTVYQNQTDLFITTLPFHWQWNLFVVFVLNLLKNPSFQSKSTKLGYAKDPVLWIFLAETKMTSCSNVKPCGRWENSDKSSWFPSHLLTSRSDKNTYEIIHQTTE